MLSEGSDPANPPNQNIGTKLKKKMRPPSRLAPEWARALLTMNVTFKQVIKRAKRIVYTRILCSTGCKLFRVYAGSKSFTIRRCFFFVWKWNVCTIKTCHFSIFGWWCRATVLIALEYGALQSLTSVRRKFGVYFHIRRFDIFIWVTQLSRTLAEMNTESLNLENVGRSVGLVRAVSVALFLTKATSTDRGNLAPVAIPCKTY